MTDTTTSETTTKTVKGFALRLSEDVELMGTHVPGHEDAYLGIKTGNTFFAVAKFISDNDLAFLGDLLKSHLIIATPLPGADSVIESRA